MNTIENSPVTDDDQYRTCPRCRGTGFADQYEEEICTTCWGDCEVPA